MQHNTDILKLQFSKNGDKKIENITENTLKYILRRHKDSQTNWKLLVFMV